ncbi:MAG: tRNA pseudouridine(38-40) synthase TruA [Cyclobacteriaceae bacterium]
MKKRYFLDISYRGTNYHGWQMQKNALSIQQIIEDCLGKLLGNETPVTASGRTDAGVHARQQIAHFDAELQISLPELQRRMNGFLPLDIAINSIVPVTEQGHARYTAYSRSYQYLIHQHKNPFLQDLSFFFWQELDVKKMNEAAEFLLGTHDFQCFSKANTDVKHYLCNITEAKWEQQKNRLVFNITANRFLRGMVRAVVGTLLEVGKRNMDPAPMKDIIKSRDRSNAGKSAPACGLYLTNVKYPIEIYL